MPPTESALTQPIIVYVYRWRLRSSHVVLSHIKNAFKMQTEVTVTKSGAATFF